MILFLTGPETYSLRAKLAEIVAKAEKSGTTESGVVRIDGGEATLGEVRSAVQAGDLFSTGKRLVIVRDWLANHSAADNEKFAELLAGTPDETIVAVAEAAPPDKRQAATKKLTKAADKSWTFEPLEARNAHINIARLGALARTYVRDFYGPSASPLHSGLGTDRIIATWEIGGERVARRLDGLAPPPSARDIERLPAVVEPAGPADAPGPTDARLDAGDNALKLAIPADVQAVKARDPGLAAAWRAATRTAFEVYFARGYRVEEFVRGEPVGWYVLRAD